MTSERKSELRDKAAVMIAAAEGKEIERRRAFTDGWELMGDDASFDFSCSEYRIKKVPTVKYIPFTAETFKEHRDRWIYDPQCLKIEAQQVLDITVDGITVICDLEIIFISWDTLVSIRSFDDTGEPCGQKVEE